MTKKSVRHIALRMGIYGGLLVFLTWIIFPPLWMILNSFKEPADTIAIPPVLFSNPPVTKAWTELFAPGSRWEGPRIYTLLLPNSLMAAGISTFLATTVALVGAYSLSRYRFKGRKLIAFAIIGTRMLPPIATAVPLYIFANHLGLLDNLFLLILLYATLNIPLSVWMLKSFVDEVPRELEESAMIDGAGRMYSFFRITVPLTAPGIVATTIFAFLLSWNDFALAFFLTSGKARTLPLIAPTFCAEAEIYYGEMGAYTTFAMIPTILFATIATKYLIRGLTLGAVKK